MTQKANRRPPHGYVLLIVLTIGIAAGLAAVALVTTAGGGRITAAHSTAGDLSNGIAQAGMDRAIAYLQAVGGSTGDFDRALDPSLNDDCSTGGNSTEDFVPVLSDTGASTVSVAYLGNKSYRMVPYNGGAYLIRFQDDDDDDQNRPEWASITGNNTAAPATNCQEGPALGGRNNPYRDRNRTLHISVIGIYPGTNPDTATHRTALHRLYTQTRPPSASGLRIRGNITVGNSTDFYACSGTGSIEVAGTVTSSSTTACACGISSATSWTGFAHCTDNTTLETTCNVTMGVGCQDGHLEDASVAVDLLPGLRTGANDYIDFSRPCVFYVDGGTGIADSGTIQGLGTTGRKSLWFWDSTALRGPGGLPCSDFEATGVAGWPGPPNPGLAAAASLATDPLNWAGCWTPLLVGDATTAGAGCVDIFGEEGATDCTWAPSNATASALVSTLIATGPLLGDFTGALGDSVGLFPATLTLNKPDWSQCSVLYPPFPEPPAVSVPHTCDPATSTTPASGGCNGSNVVLGLDENGAGNPWWTMDNVDQADAVPAGVYIWNESITVTGAGPTFSAAAAPVTRAGSDPNLSQPSAAGMTTLSYFPLMTMYVAGNIDIQQNPYYFGSGQSHNGATPAQNYNPGMIVGGTVGLSGNGEPTIGGSVYTLGGLQWTGTGVLRVFGELHSNNNFNLGGNGQFYWYYVNALQPIPPTVGFPPTLSRITQ